MTRLLDFPDELLCEILTYLSAFDAIHSFLNLNQRLNRLLSPFEHQIDLTSLSYEHSMKYIHQYLPILVRDGSLKMLKIGNQRTPGQIQLFNTLIHDEHYRRYFRDVNYVMIESSHLNELIDFVERFLLTLPQLEILILKIDSIRDEEIQRRTALIVNSLLPIRTLRKLSIEMPSGLVLSRLTETTMFDRLIDVRLNVTLVTDLLILLPHISNVEILFIRISWWSSADRTLVKMLGENTTINSIERLKKFHLTIDSILAFEFEQLEQVLHKILNVQTTSSFGFTLRNFLIQENRLTQLIDGEMWKTLLARYSLLKNFYLNIRITTTLTKDEEMSRLKSFVNEDFLQRRWFFSCLQHFSPDYFLFYSIPYKQREMFEINLRPEQLFNSFPINYTSNLSLVQASDWQSPLTSRSFHEIIERFPVMEELRFSGSYKDFSSITPIHLSSLRRLKLEKERNIDLFSLLQLFPLINTLSLSFSSTFIKNLPYKLHLYPQIVDLSFLSISTHEMDQALLFLNQFPNLRYLHVHFANRRMTDECLMTNIQQIISSSNILIYFKLQLDKNVESTIDWQRATNGRMKMFLTETIFDGVLIHFWF